MKIEKWLNFAGIFNIIVGILLFLVSEYMLIPTIFLIISGFYYRNYFNKEGPYKRKGLLILLGIFNLIFNLVSGIIALEVSGLMKDDDYKKKLKENKNVKINGLLQLGVVLVLISGIMIATNQTLVIPNLFKVIGLLLLSIMFFFLSYIGKKYLKLDSSFKTYFILGMSFIVISFIGLYYYELLGNISFGRINYLYFYPLLFLLISICSFISAKYLSVDKLYYLTISSIFITIFTWFNALEISLLYSLLLITIMVSLINYIYNPSCKLTKIVKKVSQILSYILVPINMLVLTDNYFNMYSTFLALITTLNILHIFVVNKDNFSTLISMPTLILNSLILVCMSGEVAEIKVVFFQVMMLVFYYLIKLIDIESINDLFKKFYKILFNVVFIITAFISLFMDSTASLIVTSLLLIQNIYSLFKLEKEELFLEPIKSLLFTISFITFINSKVELDLLFNLFIIEIIEVLLYLLIKNKTLKNVHYILYLVFVGLISILSTTNDDIFLVLIALISGIVPCIISMLRKEEKKLPILIFTCISLLLTNSNFVFSEIYYLNYFVTFILMIVYAYLNKRERVKMYISLFSSALLGFSFLNNISLDYGIYISLNLLVYSYLGVLIASLINTEKNKDIFMMIYFIIVILMYLFTSSTFVFVTICLITVFMVIFGFIKDFKKTKITAIILFILNLIYQLKDIWKDIPIAIYLLIIGLILIGVVVVKEIKENKK